MTDLPVESVLPELIDALKKGTRAILQAPPGAGKTTRVPVALLDRSFMAGRRILILEPRRLATRAAAARMAAGLMEQVGDTVGYRMRMERRVSSKTRIEVMTEGVFIRLLQRDPGLAGVGLVILDEFHERSLAADLALSLCLDMQGVLNDSVRLLAMSATPDTRPLSRLMDPVSVVVCSGRQHPVGTRYIGPGRAPTLSANATGAIRRALRDHTGSILVFLPGAAEIRRVQEMLENMSLGSECRVAPLFGNLTRREQQAAIEPAREGLRKIVLSTDIAETSLTIEGIEVVVDCGFRRAPRFDVSSGMTRLTTQPVSRASADQRCGRAGRLGPGICLRMWDRNRHHLLKPHNRPEILEVDLTPLALELAVWGVHDPLQLPWLDPPPDAAFRKAQQLLVELGALTDQGTGPASVTDHGRRMAALAVHPRLAHMLLTAEKEGAGPTACRLAAMLEARDFVRFPAGEWDADIGLRLDLIREFETGGRKNRPGIRIDVALCRRILKTACLLERRLKAEKRKVERVSVGRILAMGYPDRIARQREGSRRRYQMTNGRGARFENHQPLSGRSYLVVAALDGDRRESRIFLAAGYRKADLEDQFGRRIQETAHVAWDEKAGNVFAKKVRLLGGLTLERIPMENPPTEQVLAVMTEGIRRNGLACLPWTKPIRNFQARVLFLRRLTNDNDSWPDLSDGSLLETLETWLGPYIDGVTRMKQLSRIDLKNALRGHLSWRRQKILDRLAPTHLELPTGSRVPIDYQSDPPMAAVRIQQMFGKTVTPTVAGGRQPLLMHLLSPAGRPMQVTSDLAGFWKGSYHEVKKDLKARYPKHPWPDDPLSAPPTDRAKPRT